MEDDRQTAAVVEKVTNILEMLEETSNPAESMQVLAVVTVFIICNHVASAKDADNLHRHFFGIIDKAMLKAQEIGATMWTTGKTH